MIESSIYNNLKEVLGKLYFFLREEGFSVQSNAIKNLLFNLQNGEIKKIKKNVKSSIISGGAGSIFDIDMRDREKNEILNDMYNLTIELIKKLN